MTRVIESEARHKASSTTGAEHETVACSPKQKREASCYWQIRGLWVAQREPCLGAGAGMCRLTAFVLLPMSGTSSLTSRASGSGTAFRERAALLRAGDDPSW